MLTKAMPALSSVATSDKRFSKNLNKYTNCSIFTFANGTFHAQNA